MTCSLWRLISAFVSHSTLLFFSGDVLPNSGEVGADLGGPPRESVLSGGTLFSASRQ